MSFKWGAVRLLGNPGPPPGIIFGPTVGRDAIVNGAGPRTVTDPGGGTTFASSSALQSAITAAGGVATTFTCSVASPVWDNDVNCGLFGHSIIFPGAVGAKVIDAQGREISGLSGKYHLKGGTWKNFGTSNTSRGRGAIPGTDSSIEDAIFESCRIKGIAISNAHRVRVSHCKVLNCGQGGITGGNSDDLVIEDNDIDSNNSNPLWQTNPGGTDEGHGLKLLIGGRMRVRRNFAHGNRGPGLWLDTACYDFDVEENVCEDNYWSGLFSEANYGGRWRHNWIKNNGRDVVIGGAIATFSSTVNVRLADNSADRAAPDGLVYPLDVSFNMVDHTLAQAGQTGCILLVWDHTDSSVRHVSNNDVHHNQFWLRFTHTVGGNMSRIRATDTVSPDFQLWDLDNSFFQNEYHVLSGQEAADWWYWDTGLGQGVLKDYNEWQTFHPNDNLSLITI